jgi:hypothetical protein
MKVRVVGPNDCVFDGRVYVPGEIAEIDADVASREVKLGSVVQYIEPPEVETAESPAARKAK